MSDMTDKREQIRRMAQEHLGRGDATGWFERLYHEAGGEAMAIPWAELKVNPNFLQWAQKVNLAGEGKRALVVGCGLGDDAEALSAMGFEVTAFDVAPTAIEWARKRFPESLVTYRVADLFEAPSQWKGAFDFVLEAYTIQALPMELREMAIEAVAAFVAKGGKALVVCRGKDDGQAVDGPPWPVSRPELETFKEYGLVEATFEDYLEPEEPPARRFRVEYPRPFTLR